MRRNQKRGLSYTATAVIAIVVIVIVTYLSFTKEIPFRGKYHVNAVMQTSNNLKAGSFVRIAGVNVGKVTNVEPVGRGETAARVTMEISEKGRPIHKDATLKVRPRILFEGNFFVDLQPGSPSAPELADGETIPINQTAGPVQFDQVLGVFQSDTRRDLKTLLHELDAALSKGGADAVNRTTQYWEPAYRDGAIVNEAMLGLRPRDLSGYIDGMGDVAEGLDRNPRQLQALLSDLRITAGAFAARSSQLERAIAELPRTLRAGQPALAALNRAFPSLRRFTAELRPGVRNSAETLDAQIPFVRQLRGLVQRKELRGLAADLRPTVPALAQLNKATIPLLEEVRAASSCQNEVVLPWTLDKIEDPAFPAIGPVYEEQTKPLVGLAGESRTFDANGQWFRVALNGGQFATPQGAGSFLLTDRPLVAANPPKPAKRSPLRPEVPCETQEQPDLRTNASPLSEASFPVREAPPSAEAAARAKAVDWLRTELRKQGRDTPVVDEVLKAADLSKLPKVPGAPEVGGR